MVKKGSNTNDYLPMQKSLKIDPSISSTSTFPTIVPRCLVANLKSSAALSKSSTEFLFSKLIKCSTQFSSSALCLSLVMKISPDKLNLFFNFF